MEFGNENVRVRKEGDRISRLPDDIIHLIMSYNDTKYAVQTSVLSSRWRFIWTTLPYLSFRSDKFRNRPKFSKFVKWVLIHRNNLIEVSSLDLNYEGPMNQRFMQIIGDYVVSHNVQKVNIFVYKLKRMKGHQLPLCFFSSQSLKHLSVKTDRDRSYGIYPLPQSPWDFPALTTIELNDTVLCEHTMCLDLFSKCVSLKNLTLSNCEVHGSKVVKIACPRLVSLTLSWCVYPKYYEILAPNLSSFCFEGIALPILSTGGLNSLENVNVHANITALTPNNEEQAHMFLNMLYELRNARFLTLRGYFIELLFDVLDLLEDQASPLCNLKCLRMERVETEQKGTQSDLSKMISYLLNSSPTATVII